MAYLTLEHDSNGFYEEKKSKFYSFAKRVEDEEQAEDFIKEIRERNKQARHNCFAYVIGKEKVAQKYSDDGEPQKTAGPPILELIKLNDLTDICIVVTRYFGGILLGASNLTRAYKKAASLSLRTENIIEKILAINVEITFSYEFLGKIQYYLRQENIETDNIKYEDKVLIKIVIDERSCDYFEKNYFNWWRNSRSCYSQFSIN